MSTQPTTRNTAPTITTYQEDPSLDNTAETQQAAVQQWEQDNPDENGGDTTGTAPPANVTAQQGSTPGAWNVVVNTSQDGLASAGAPSSSTSTSSSNPAVVQIANSIQNGDHAGATQQFKDLLTDSWMNDPNVSVNGLIQAVMRNSYEDNQGDLKYYAQKVQFFNNVKKAIRDQLSTARTFQATHESAGGSNSANASFTGSYQAPAMPETDFHGSTDVTPSQSQSQLDSSASNPATTTSGSTETDGTVSSTGSTGTDDGTSTDGSGSTDGSTSSGVANTSGTSATTSNATPQGGGVTELSPADVKALNPPLAPPLVDPSNASNKSTDADWKVYKTKDNNIIAVNMNGTSNPGGAGSGELRLYNNTGAITNQVWGDPHMLRQNDDKSFSLYSLPDGNKTKGTDVGDNSAIQLPDGTTIGLGITPDAAGDGKSALSSINIVSANDHVSVTGGTSNTTTATRSEDGANYLSQNAQYSAGGGMLADDMTTGKESIRQADGTYQGLADQATAANTQLKGDGNATNVTAQQKAGGAQGGQTITTAKDMDAYVQNLEDKMSSVGDDAQLAQVDLQNMAQKQQQTLQTLSTLSKSFHDLSMAIIRNIP